MPANGATGVDAGNPVSATFNEAMNASTITTSTFTLSVTGGAAVAGTVTYSAGTTTATFTPTAALAFNTSYTATITTGVKSSGGVALAANFVWTFTTSANPSVAAVDFGTTYQTIRGFGGSTAWLGQLTTQQANALFSPTTGLGLSILRVRIDPTGAAGSNYVTVNWTQELANAQAAIAANSNAIVFASPWTPPTAMKTSSANQPYYSGASACSPGPDYCGGYLDPSHYGDYANYLEDFVTYFKNNNVDLHAISMQNEPDWSAQPTENYESCSWTAQQMDTWVASLTANSATNPITTKLIMPESLNFNPAQSNPTLADPNAVGNVSIIGGHLYGASPTYYGTAISDLKDVWMTEHYLTPSGSQPNITDALALAEEIHNSMTLGYYNAYVYWWIWDDPNDAINYGLINSSTTNPAPTYYGDAIGQFSEFIQPGYVRVSATASPLSGVYVSAYSNSSPDHHVIVAINSNTSPDNLTFELTNGTVTSVTPYETTATSTLAAQSAVTVTGGQFNYTLPAQSIVTFVQ
jgi:glucuronoarabinoxylan endo-1,4-beta-xylanase